MAPTWLRRAWCLCRRASNTPVATPPLIAPPFAAVMPQVYVQLSTRLITIHSPRRHPPPVYCSPRRRRPRFMISSPLRRPKYALPPPPVYVQPAPPPVYMQPAPPPPIYVQPAPPPPPVCFPAAATGPALVLRCAAAGSRRPVIRVAKPVPVPAALALCIGARSSGAISSTLGKSGIC